MAVVVFIVEQITPGPNSSCPVRFLPDPELGRVWEAELLGFMQLHQVKLDSKCTSRAQTFPLFPSSGGVAGPNLGPNLAQPPCYGLYYPLQIHVLKPYSPRWVYLG